MGLLIDLERRVYASQQIEIEGRIDIGLTALAVYMGGKYFKPQRLQIWKDTPRKEMGGQMLQELSLEGLIDTRDIKKNIGQLITNDYKQLAGTVMIVGGKWQIADYEQEGYFSINHALDWKKAYGDIEADFNPDAPDDLVAVIWKDRVLRIELVDRFFEKFLSNYDTQNYSKRLGMRLRWVCFALGTPTRFDIRAIKAAYYGRERTFVADAFKTFRDKNAAQRSLEIEYLVEKAYEQPVFEKAIESNFVAFKVKKKPDHSIIFIGEDFDSFEKLYDKLAADYIEPILSNLPNDQYVDGVVREIVTKHKPLEFYSPSDEGKSIDSSDDVKSKFDDKSRDKSRRLPP